MPKRPCPFDDNLPPQLKIHVGQKQINNGVSREERMKHVYDKTLNMLKEGVKALSERFNVSADREINIADDSCMVKRFPMKSKHERYTKQMVLNTKLELMDANRPIEDLQPKYDLCECNRVVNQTMLHKCSYCDQVLCASCRLECAKCSELLCQNCSLPIYDNEERNVCLNCYQYN